MLKLDKKDQVLFLVGPMGAGKTTVGKALAEALGSRFLDHDDLIVHLAGCSIPEIFKEHGEPYFRQFEHDCLDASLTGTDAVFSAEKKVPLLPLPAHAVVAGGGGIAGRADNRELIRQNSVCIYLHLEVEEQYQRVKDDTNRPMIHVSDIKGRLNELFLQRDPQWREIADLIINTNDTVDNIVARCIKELTALGVLEAK